jgi:hypothetical protein
LEHKRNNFVYSAVTHDSRGSWLSGAIKPPPFMASNFRDLLR